MEHTPENNESVQLPGAPANGAALNQAAGSKTRAPRSKAATKQAAPAGASSTDPMERLVCITLHDSREIPPGGQFVGVNGKHFWIQPGRKVIVPYYVCKALDNAVHGVPELDDNMRVSEIRQAPRLPYTVHMDEMLA